MSARTGRLIFSYEWTDADGNVFKPVARTTMIPYSTAVKGEIPIPAGTAEGAEVDLTLPNITTACTLVIIENLSGQDLGMAWGGNFSPDLGIGATMLYACPAPPSQGGITGLRFFLRQAQVVDGLIAYAVLGA